MKNLGRLWLAYTELQGDFTCYNSHLLTLGTLHSQNSAYGGPIYTKQKTLVFAFPALNRCVRIVKVTKVDHFENLTLLYHSGAIGHQAWAQVLSLGMVTPLYNNIFHEKNSRAQVWCHS